MLFRSSIKINPTAIGRVYFFTCQNLELECYNYSCKEVGSSLKIIVGLAFFVSSVGHIFAIEEVIHIKSKDDGLTKTLRNELIRKAEIIDEEIWKFGILLLFIGKISLTYELRLPGDLQIFKRYISKGIARDKRWREGNLSRAEIDNFPRFILRMIVSISVSAKGKIGLPEECIGDFYKGICLETESVAIPAVFPKRIARFADIPCEDELVGIAHIIKIGIEP